MSDVVNIRKDPFCMICCSSFCYCSKDSLMKQVRHTLDTIQERNAELADLKAKYQKAVKIIKLCKTGPSHIPSEEDQQIRNICGLYGYGNVMNHVSNLYRESLQKVGLDGAEFTVGPCTDTLELFLEELGEKE